MKGKFWLLVGVAIGVAVWVLKVPYLAGAGQSFATTLEKVVASIAHWLGSSGTSVSTKSGNYNASPRIVDGFSGLGSALLPGITAVVLIFAAKSIRRVRWVVAILLAALGVASFSYFSHGSAMGVLVLSLVVAFLSVTMAGPLVVTPLAALAALIACEYLPHLFSSKALTDGPVGLIHQAFWSSPGQPSWLQLVVFVVACAPFVLAGRLVLR